LTCRCRFKVWSRLTPSVVTVSERCTTEPAMLMDVMCGNARSQQIRDLLQAKNEAHAAKLRNPTSTTHHNNWKELRSKAQRELRQMENKWWIERAQEIQQYADANEVQKFY